MIENLNRMIGSRGMMLREKLFDYANTFITLDQLEMRSHAKTYEQFAKEVIQLEKEGIISSVKSAGQNGKDPSLSYKYKIQKGKLRQTFYQEIERIRLHLHPALHLDHYYNASRQEWNEQLPFIKKISDYLQTNGFPHEEVPAPERSLALVGDEKWIQEKGGATLLQRLNIWEQMKIVPVHDPLSFAINPNKINNDDHLHLIVENKTTFDGLISELIHTPFTTLIYGQGYKITKTIEHFSHQLPLRGEHIIYYFGDIDWEGIKIWHLLSEKIDVIPAIPFYEVALTKQVIPLTKKQKPNEEANRAFFSHFYEKAVEKMLAILNRNEYLPQEVLSSQELKEIWRESDWSDKLRKIIKND